MWTKRNYLYLSCLILFNGFLALSCQAQGNINQVDKVTEIRFGIIEPPVVAQSDITVRAPQSNQQLEPKPLECSGLEWIDGQLLILSDRHDHMVFTSKLDLQNMSIGTPQPHIIIKNEQQLLRDAECLTVKRSPSGGHMVYVLCSLSNDRTELPLPKRRHMLRFRLTKIQPFTYRNQLVVDTGTLRDNINTYFEAAGTKPYRAFYSDFTGPDKNTYRWGNIEGMTFTPDGSALICAMRNPLHNDKAILLVIKGLDESFTAINPKNLQINDIFTLDLASRGISDISWDPLTKGYIITAAKSSGPKLSQDQPYPPNTLDSALFWWSGRKSESPVLFAECPDMKVEAVCRLGPSPYIAIGSDEADLSEGRTLQQQSLLTILYFTGIELEK
ncbi:MAG: hypothetical protein ACYST2_00450 [Planctomycetota bacterium]|jgi:hypothetical protein